MKSNQWRLLAGIASISWLLLGAEAQATTLYLPGVSPTLSGVFSLGTHLPNYIGPSNGSAADGTNLDGNRVYIFDVNDPAGVSGPTASDPANFHLLVWQFPSAMDSVRLYTHQDHYFGGSTAGLEPELLEYSVWGCNGPTGGCTSANQWTLLSDPIGWTLVGGLPVYNFAGLAPAATIFRGGSTEFGLTNAYVQDFTFASGYNFYAIRGSSIAMQANTADPELDAMVAFNRVNVTPGGNPTGVPEPSSLALLGAGLAGLVAMRRRRKAAT